MTTATPSTTTVLSAPSRQTVKRSYAVLPLLWVLLCIIIPAWVTPEKIRDLNWLLAALTFSIILYSGTRISLIISAGIPAWLPFMFWSFTYIWIGLSMYAQDLSGRNPYNVTLGVDSQWRACVVVLVGLVCFDLGAKWPNRRRIGSYRSPRVLSRQRTVALVVATLIVVPFLIETSGGWALLFASRSERVLQQSNTTLAVYDITWSLTAMMPLVASASILSLLRSHRELRRRPAWIIAGALCVILALSVTNPIGNARFISGTVILGLLFSIGLSQRGRIFRLTACFVFLALLLVFPFADLFRYNTQSTLTLQPLSSLITSKGDYDTGVQMVASIDFRQASGGTGGRQILGALGFFVPRSYWPDKPGATGTLISNYLNYPNANVSSPLWVEAYVDGGDIAVIIVFATLGFGMRRASDVYLRDQDTTSAVRLTVPLVAAYSLIVFRGSLLSVAGPLVVMLALGWLVTYRPVCRSMGSSPPLDGSVEGGQTKSQRSVRALERS